MTQAILDSLTRLSPGAREAFARNRDHFLERLDARMDRWSDRLAPYRGARLVVYHDSWPYFARRFGLVIVAAVEPIPGVPPSPGSLAALTASMKDARVPVRSWSRPRIAPSPPAWLRRAGRASSR